jgi:hypothetical protein
MLDPRQASAVIIAMASRSAIALIAQFIAALASWSAHLPPQDAGQHDLADHQGWRKP